MYCKNCGNPIQPFESKCQHCGAPNGIGSSFCPKCGAPTSINASFCQECGTSLKTNEDNRQNTYQSPVSYSAPAVAPAGKSKVAAGILGILLGSLGIHNFYLGFTGKAMAQLLISVLSCGTLSFVSALWGLVEGIMILCGNINVDAQGNLLHE